MIYLLLSNLLTMLAFVIGIKIGYKLRRDEKIEIIPNIPKIINEQAKQKEQDKELNAYNKVLQNVSNYNGTPEGQVEIE